MTISGNYADETALTVFDRTLEHIFYQTNFRCEKFLTRVPFSPDNKGKMQRTNRIFSEGLPVKLSERFTPIAPTHETKFDSRWLATETIVATEYVDNKDIQESLMDPTGELAQRQVEMFNRQLDIDSVNFMFSPVMVGASESVMTPISFAADGGQTIDMTAGATYADLLNINQILIDREVANNGPIKKYMSVDGVMCTQFLNEIELTSGDYTRENTIDEGEIVRAAGIEFIRFGSGADVPDPILPVFNGIRTGFMVTDKAMKFAVQKELATVVERDPTHYDTWRIITTMRYGMVRRDARQVLKILTTAS
jgi:Phage capsid protein